MIAERIEVLAFPEFRTQAASLAEALGCPCHDVAIHRFPDQESLVQLPPEVATHAIFCRSLHHPNEKLIELMLAARTARALGAKTITLVAPYLCYMRQDIAFHPGEAVSQRVIGRFLADQVDNLITVDPHLHRTHTLAEAVPARRAQALTAADIMGEFIGQRLHDPLLVGPDSESEQWVQRIAETAGLQYIVAEKHRTDDREVQVTLPPAAYQGREAVLVDDMASTGRTLAAAARALDSAGAARIYALVTHALFAEDAETCLENSPIAAVWSTDSVPHRTNAIALGPLLAGGVRGET